MTRLRKMPAATKKAKRPVRSGAGAPARGLAVSVKLPD
jgi:hypothetical protein